MKTVLTIILTLHVAFSCIGQVTLAWDPSIDTNVAGYYLCYGTNSASYFLTNSTDSFTCTNKVTNLSLGMWYFAVQAFDEYGNVSDFSNEVTWTNIPSPVVVIPPEVLERMKAKKLNARKAEVKSHVNLRK